MKRLCFLLFFLLLSSGCSAKTAPETLWVEDIFTQPQSSIESTLPPIAPIEAGNYVRIENHIEKDELGSYLIYEGGEMHLRLQIRVSELDDKDFGIHLYVDGQPQAYHTEASSASSYMHSFRSCNGKEQQAELIFTPVTGRSGEMLEISFVLIAYPDYFPDEAWDGTTMIDWNSMGLTVRMFYQTDSPCISPLDVPDRLKALSMVYTDLTSAEAKLFSGGTYQKEVEYTFHVNQKKDFGNLFSVKPGDNLEFEFELKGSHLADFGLVLYLDHLPISVKPEELIFLGTENGQKVTIRAQIDISDFDGKEVLYAVLVPRNLRRDDLGGSCLVTVLGPWYLFGSDSMEAAT